MSNLVHIDTEEEISEMHDAILRQRVEMENLYARLNAMDHSADINRLNDLVGSDSAASKIAARILLSVHQKGGVEIDIFDLRHLDLTNQSAALRLIERCGHPSTLSDSGLAGILAGHQIDDLKNHV